MIEPAQVQALGLAVRHTGATWEADLDLSAALVNPLSQKIIHKVTLTPLGDRLMATDPPDVVGLAPLSLSGVTKASALEDQLSSAFDEYIFLLQRRSEELQALGLSARVSPETLQLSTEVQVDVYVFTLVSDKRGSFRVAQALKEGRPVQSDFGQVFEITEFRDRQALADYLVAMVSEPVGRAPRPPPAPVGAILFDEVLAAIGPGARLPPRSGLELLVSVRVRNQEYRFAAARVMGRTFRGLLAGPQGKVWAGRFELEDFPGVRALVATSLEVSLDSVEILSPGAA